MPAVMPPILIDDVSPRTPAGLPAKAIVGDPVAVSAVILRDGHGQRAARVRWRLKEGVGADRDRWMSSPLVPSGAGDDRWVGTFPAPGPGLAEFVVEAWTDRFGTWRRDLRTRHGAGENLTPEFAEGAALLESLLDEVDTAHRERVSDTIATLRSESCSEHVRLNAALDDALADLMAGIADRHDLTGSDAMPLRVERERAAFGAWYEFFPRSEGGLLGAARRLDAVAAAGFDVVYLPPIHPIGITHRKGRNNTLTALAGDPGSPWAIGGPAGGHTAVEPSLGDLADFDALVARARTLDLEIAMDLAFQCSPDHPWVREHPEWFRRRVDGSIRYAENPPKKYQDIHPIEFWPDDDADRVALWEACRDVVRFWVDRGVRILRVDNPHTKPPAFWAWLLPEVQRTHPDVVFLAEAFTMPAMMHKLAELGFSQSYTYFTWRVTAGELRAYGEELAHGPAAGYFRPNLWPNTPDILAGPLRHGNRAAFQIRLLLAATLSPSYGIYSGYELCENQPASEANEEYLDSEKYQVVTRDWSRSDSLWPWITRINDLRRRHRAFRRIGSLRFHETDNPQLLAYSHMSPDGGDRVLVVVNLDPDHWHEGTVSVDCGSLGLPWEGTYPAHDELTGETYTWSGSRNYVRLDPARTVGHVLALG